VQPGRILALDYGTRNVGLATSDELGVVIRPLPSIPNLNRRDLMRRLAAIVKELRVELLVVGLPLHMDGSSGDAAEQVRRFSGRLRDAMRMPLIEVDERLSSIEAEEIWRGMNARQRRRYRTLDSLAAACILERYLRES
jgi:putative Holliday junction resolvase